jgi:hypothetical protein
VCGASPTYRVKPPLRAPFDPCSHRGQRELRPRHKGVFAVFACTCSQFWKGSAFGAAFPGFQRLYPLQYASGPGYKEQIMTFLGAWIATTPGEPSWMLMNHWPDGELL